MALTGEQLRAIVADLLTRPGHEKVRTHVHNLLVLHLGAPSSDVHFEQQVPEVHGRLDALLGRTIFEFKSDLRKEAKEAERQLTNYLADREQSTGQRYMGIATDGAEFVPYELRHGKLIGLTPFKPVRDKPRELALWLTPFLARETDKVPEPYEIAHELGRESLVYEVSRERLVDLWASVSKEPDVALKRRLWAERLKLVYGSSVDDDSLFLQHTYLTVVAKTIATLVLGAEVPSPDDLLSGRPFQDAGIEGVIESDFFDWVLSAQGSDDLIRRIAGQVRRFRFDDIKHDVLKGLYESLVDPEQRHDLGEYYTPDWLAARICDKAIVDPLNQRVLDPACGSGTFLFHAARRFLAAADEAGQSNEEALLACTRNVIGIDVHPVAVINARITYLLALGEQRLRNRKSRLNVPVYLGDSLQWNTEQIVLGREIRIDVPDSPPLIFPVGVAQNPSLFDAVIGEMLRLSEAKASLEAFEGWLARQRHEELQGENAIKALTRTYERLAKLSSQKRNHIWGYIARNLSRPVWLSSPGEKVDVLVGNPPWLSYRYMSSDIRERFRKECSKRGMWAGGKVATHQDLSAYFFVRCMELYLGKRGDIAFVMPYAAMTRKQYRGFITRVERGEKGPVVVPARRFTDAWIFDESVQPLFPVPSCVLFGKDGDAEALPANVTLYSGLLPRRDAGVEEAEERLAARKVPWPTGSDEKASYYGKRFRQGATVVPRRFFVVVRVEEGRFGTNSNEPVVESRGAALEKKPWKDLKPLRGTIEKEFLRPLYLGESVAPFRILRSLEAVIPWDHKLGLLDAKNAELKGFAGLARWLKEAESLWRRHGKNRMTLIQRLDYQHELTAQMPPPKLRVLYSKAGTLPAATLLREDGVIDHKLYWAKAQTEREGTYLIAVLNSERLRSLVAPFQSKGQWGARDFDKLLARAIPEFDAGEGLHCEIADSAERAERVAGKVDLPEGVHFVRARQKIRAALIEDGIAAKIESVVQRLLERTPRTKVSEASEVR